MVIWNLILDFLNDNKSLFRNKMDPIYVLWLLGQDNAILTFSKN